ncbi:MAG: cation-translocating P-type ATPase [Fuerstiella sp.]
MILQDDDELREHFLNQSRHNVCSDFVQMDHTVFHDRYVRPLSNRHSRVRLLVEGITCNGCIWAIEKLPSYLSGVIQARVNLSTGFVTIDWDPTARNLSDIALTLNKLGYRLHPADECLKDDLDRADNRRQLMQMALAGACAGNTMLIAFALYFGVTSGMALNDMQLFRWTSAAIASVSLAFPGRIFFRNAWNSLQAKTPHMDLPVAVGLTAGICLGIVNTVLGRGEVYFDSLTLLVFLLLVGRYIQYYQQRKAIRQVSLRNALIPQAVRRCLPSAASISNQVASFDAQVEIIPPEAIKKGDQLQIRAGDLVPIDSVIREGHSSIDESILTGESVAVARGRGDSVSAGTTNLTGLLVVEATEVLGQSRIDRIAELVEAGLQAKTPIVQFANRIGGYFVVAILGLAAVTFSLWASTGIETAFNHSLSLLVVACPCALGLATPFTIAIAQARAARSGILIKAGDAFERLNGGHIIWLDKTGTITSGRPELHDWHGDRSIISAVVAIESQVVHPLAETLVRELRNNQSEIAIASHVKVVAGKGVCGLVNGRRILVGSLQLLESEDCVIDRSFIEQTKLSHQLARTSLMVAVDGKCVAVCSIGDSIREDVAEVVADLQDRGHQVGLLSGDHPDVVLKVGQSIGIEVERCMGCVSPEGKLKMIQQSAESSNVVMVGDGVNDSAALAAAGVGIAVKGGASASMEAADVSMKEQGLRGIVQLLDAATVTVRTIWINFAASLAYNVIAAGLAMAGLIHPILAAILMPLSSLTVVLIAFLNPAFRKANR